MTRDGTESETDCKNYVDESSSIGYFQRFVP